MASPAHKKKTSLGSMGTPLRVDRTYGSDWSLAMSPPPTGELLKLGFGIVFSSIIMILIVRRGTGDNSEAKVAGGASPDERRLARLQPLHHGAGGARVRHAPA